MKSLVAAAFLVLISMAVSGQNSGQHEAFGAGGQEFSNGSTSINYTVGEVVIETVSDTTGNTTLTQGYQQPLYNITSLDEISNLNFELRVWPVPTRRYLNIEATGTELINEFTIEILNMGGVSLDRFQLANGEQIDLTTYPVSTYFLKIYNPAGDQVRVFQIIKN
jgi:hypothetical protein